MGRRRAPDRVLGPYGPVGDPPRWRVVLVVTGEDGVQRRQDLIYESQEEAEREVSRGRVNLQQQAAILVRDAIDLFLAQLTEVRPITREATALRLCSYYAPVLDEPLQVLQRPAPRRPDQPPRAPTITRAADLYRELRERESARPRRRDQPPDQRLVLTAATHRRYLRDAHRAARWWVSQHLLVRDPLDGVQGVGKVRKGKPQLRLDEARLLTALLFTRAAEPGLVGRRQAVAVLLLIFLALREGEVITRRVRDVDDGGRRLVLDEADDPLKTDAAAAGAREVPAQLVPLLRELAAGRPADHYLFGDAQHHLSGDWLLKVVQRLCRAAGVRAVCAHALRGLAASLLARSGASAHLIAELLRHGDSGRTALQHYVEQGALGEGQRQGLAGLLLPPAEGNLVARLRALAERWRGEGRGDCADELLAELDR